MIVNSLQSIFRSLNYIIWICNASLYADKNFISFRKRKRWQVASMFAGIYPFSGIKSYWINLNVCFGASSRSMYLWTYIWDIVCDHLSWIVSQNILVKPTCSPLHLWYLAQEYVRIYHHCVLMVFGGNYIPSTVYNFFKIMFPIFLTDQNIEPMFLY